MNEFHKHLILNHFPVIGIIFAALVLLTGLVLRSDIVKRVSFAFFILVAIVTIPTNESGEEAEHAIKKSDRFEQIYIENHEEDAEFAFWISIITGILASIAMWFSYKEHELRGILDIIVFIVSIFAIYYLWKTGQSGGKIGHPEIIMPE
ncbi:MAG: hypothetical protein H6605_09320 [Flavobacteriales bacterium]|nr:hypothetical protein [Flavobacteriales bacterium]